MPGRTGQIGLSLVAEGLTTGEVSAHVADVYGAKVNKDNTSRIVDGVVAEMTDWLNLPLDRVCPVVFADAIRTMDGEDRDRQVTNRPVYVAIGVMVDEIRKVIFATQRSSRSTPLPARRPGPG